MLGAIHADDVCIINIGQAKINDATITQFRDEIVKAIRYGLFPFAEPKATDVNRVESSFTVNTIGASSDKNRSAFSICCDEQGAWGATRIMDIRKGQKLRFMFFKETKESPYFTCFSTNLSPKLFQTLLYSCTITANVLHESLKGSEYYILLPKKAKEKLKTLDSYLSSGKPDIRKSYELVGTMMNDMDTLLSEEQNKISLPDNETSIGKKREECERICDASFQRNKTIARKDEDSFKDALYDPADITTINHVAEYEIIPQLTGAAIFSHLPENPVIIDVGCASGINLRKIHKAIPQAITLGVDPIHVKGSTHYIGKIEHIPDIHGKADLVTVFKNNPESNFDAFYSTLAKLVVPGGTVLVGEHFNDLPVTWSGKTLYAHLQEHFNEVKKLPNPECYTQTLYLAMNPKEVQMPAPLNPFMDQCKGHMVAFIKKEEAVRVQIPEDVQNNLVLEGFLQKVKEKHPERGADPSLVLDSASSSKESASMAKAS